MYVIMQYYRRVSQCWNVESDFRILCVPRYIPTSGSRMLSSCQSPRRKTREKVFRGGSARLSADPFGCHKLGPVQHRGHAVVPCLPRFLLFPHGLHQRRRLQVGSMVMSLGVASTLFGALFSFTRQLATNLSST